MKGETKSSDAQDIAQEFEQLREERYRLEIEACEEELRKVEDETHREFLAQITEINEQEKQELDELENWKDKMLASATVVRDCIFEEEKFTLEERLDEIKQSLHRELSMEQEDVIMTYIRERQREDLRQARQLATNLFGSKWLKRGTQRKNRASSKLDDIRLKRLPPIVHKLSPYDINHDLFVLERVT
eukprot:gene805-7889_t